MEVGYNQHEKRGGRSTAPLASGKFGLNPANGLDDLGAIAEGGKTEVAFAARSKAAAGCADDVALA